MIWWSDHNRLVVQLRCVRRNIVYYFLETKNHGFLLSGHSLFLFLVWLWQDAMWTKLILYSYKMVGYIVCLTKNSQVFGLVHLQVNDFFEMAPLSTTRGHAYKLYKKRSSATGRCVFFIERVINTCNNLPNSVDFTNLTIKKDLSVLLNVLICLVTWGVLAVTLYLGLLFPLLLLFYFIVVSAP